MARYEALSDERKASILESLMGVGPSKPIGYLPLCTIQDVLGVPVAVLLKQMMPRGILALKLNSKECCIKSGALYFYDPVALENLLRVASDDLKQCGWPRTPAEFVKHIAANWYESDHPLIGLIRMAFGEDKNGRDEPGHFKSANR
ncbi:hypothetical protein [Bosea caraganae]|uniref:hypothetical protein n=1 Tax=Bosea caraganae TaxID=2763117 RepID=UPI0011C06986|nr:hypothetical protein [Bosea caraganae]